MGWLDRGLLALRTARYFRGRQIIHLIRRRLTARPRPRATGVEWNASRAAEIARALSALGPVSRPQDAIDVATEWRAGRVRAVGHVAPVPVTWRERSPNRLFEYHTHYHDALADAAWVAATQHDDALRASVGANVRRWVTAWRAGGSPAWDPYPIAVRAMNWIRMCGWGALDSRDSNVGDSLAQQIDVLARDLEGHLQGNHLLRDAWALAVVPGCFIGEWTEAWWRRGHDFFWKCLLDQVDEDGVHEERSPMYQARILRDALEVIAVSDALSLPVPVAARARVGAMATALDWMRHADGSLRLINDSAGDHGVDIDRTIEMGRRATDSASAPAHGVWWARSARFAAARDAARANGIFVDLGGPSPPHQPGHAHAGALGFECEIDGQRVVTDGGCSGYDDDPWRSYFRGTAAHSTIVIDDRDQSEMWATFRVARRARVENVRVTPDGDAVEMRARCRPYHRPRAAHERVIRWSPTSVAIADTVPGAEGRAIASYVHFDPAWTAERSGDGVFVLTQGSARVIVRVAGAPHAALHHGDRAPVCGWRARGFNDVVPSVSLRLSSPLYGGEEWRIAIARG